LYATGGGLTHRAYEYAPDKTRTLAFDLGKDADGSDLAADQCTLMFASGKTIQRYDICRSVLLAPLTATLTEFGTALRIAPDGSVLVAQLGSGEVPPIIARIRADGTTMMTYPGATRVIALDPDKRSFWRADGPALYKVDLATGVILRGPINLPADNEGVTGLAIFGEPRAATSEGLPAEAIPTLSTWTLLAFGMALTAVASLRAR
jgi:hypothetical protein